MSGSSRRRISKWDHVDSETLPANYHERATPRKPRETLSPSRASRRHESRGKESVVPWDREGNSARISPELDDWSERHHSRSPRNDWGRSYRSRSRSRSRSPAQRSRREPAGSDRSRGKSGVSGQICRDFSAGRCRRGSHCQFLHPDGELYDSGRPLKSSPPDEWDSRHRRIKGSRYSPDDTRDYAVRSEGSANLCNEFVKGNCRRGASCRYLHHDAVVDVIEKGPVDDVYRDRENDHRSRDTLPDWNRDRELPRRADTQLCKFFSVGNCRNGKRCRFSHQVQEGYSPERQSQDDRQGPDHKFENALVWDGPTWSEPTRMPDIPAVPGWGEDKNEIPEPAKEMTTARSGEDSWSHVVNHNQTWDATVGFDEPKSRDGGQPFLWKTENSVPGMENISGDMEISPRDTLKLHSFHSPDPQTLPNMPLPAVQQNTTGETSYEKHYLHAFHEQKVYNDSYSGMNPNFKDDMPPTYPVEGRNGIGNHDNTHVTPNPPVNVPPARGIFQNDPRVNGQPISSINPSAGQGQLPVPSNHSVRNGMQMPTSHNSSSFLDGKVADGPHLVDTNASSIASAASTKPNTVSSEQLAQLSHLTASLAQLLESRQLPQPPSGVTPNGMSNHPDPAASIPPVSGARTFLPNQAPDMLKQYDPISDSTEPKLHNSTFLSVIEQRSSDNEVVHDTGTETLAAASKDDENGGKVAEGGSKAPENGPSDDIGVDDGADDGKKSKDVKGMRTFKFALADFVKELLKPTWKDGQVSKEVYKTIVKKVVDKVIETLGPQIPQTKEKIDQYLSYSKPKLDKLVQAYVGKYQKGKG